MMWEVKPLGEVFKFQGGTQPPKSKFEYEPKPGFVRLLQIQDFSRDDRHVYIPSESSKRRCTAQDILIGRYGASVGRVCVGLEGAFNVALVKVIPKVELNLRFAEYYFRSPLFQGPLLLVSHRSAQSGFNVEGIKDFIFPCPSTNRQQEIVALLDSAFEKIDKAKANVERNLKNTEELFQSALDEVFSNPGEDWEVKALGEVCQIRTGKVDVNSGNPDGKYAFFTCARLPTRSDVYAFDCEAILIAGNGEVGLSHYYRGKFQAYQRTYVLSGFKGLIGMYLKYAIDFKLIPHLMSRTQGTAIPYIRKGGLSSCPIICPPAVNQKEIVSRLDALSGHRDEVVAKCNQELHDLEELRQSILEQAFVGKLTSTKSQ